MIYECRVCLEETEQIDDWKVVTMFSDEFQNVDILTCPDCAKLGFKEILAAHQYRIKTGEDPKYH